MITNKLRSKLHQNLIECFNEEELHTLCFDLGIEYENLPGSGKADKARELILHLERRKRTAELIKLCREQRPEIPWEDTPGVTTQPAASNQPIPSLPTGSSIPSIALDAQSDSILIVTVTKVEAQAVLKAFSQADDEKQTRRQIGNKTYYPLGVHGGVPIFMVQSEMGAGTPGGALLTVRQAIQDLRPQAVIMCGVAFGLRRDKHQLKEILVARQLQCYEPQKVDIQRGQMPRGDRVMAAERLLDRFRSGDIEWQGPKVHFGLVLSGEKLINDPDFRDWLLKVEPEAIGGEMEGAGLYAAARDAKVDWILVKAICDWADGTKNDDVQIEAANNAARFVLHVLRLGGWRPESLPSEAPRAKPILDRLQPIYILILVPFLALFAAFGLKQGWFIQPMAPGFNVAVARFTAADAAAQQACMTGQTELGDWLFDAISHELAAWPSDLHPHVRGPTEIGTIAGLDRVARARRAEVVAEKHNASVVIYGVVASGPGGCVVAPEFSVSPRQEGFDYGSEVAGPERLGQPVAYTLPLDSPATLRGINIKLNGRTRALRNLIAGLSDFSTSDFLVAYAKFDNAANEQDWAPGEGKEVAHLLKGAAALRYFDASGKAEALEWATEAFSEAQRLNPQYDRAYLGLGTVVLQRAGQSFAVGDATALDAALTQAQGWYLQSQATVEHTPGVGVDAKAAAGLGQVYTLGYQCRLSALCAGDWPLVAARAHYDYALRVYREQGQPADLLWVAGHAQAGLGWVAGAGNDWPGMSDGYRAAIDLLGAIRPKAPFNWIARYWAFVGFAEEQRNNRSAAQSAYRNAVTNGKAASTGVIYRSVRPDELAGWQEKMDRLEGGGN